MPLGGDLTVGQPADAQAIAERVTWLSFHRLWGRLADASLQALAACLQTVTVEAETLLYQQGQAAIGLYLLKWGSVEIYRPSPVGRTHIHYHSAGDLFGYIPLVSGSLADTVETRYQANAIALTPSEIWFLPQAQFAHLIQTYPDIQTPLNQLLAQDLTKFAQRIAWEETRIQALQGYIRPVPPQATVIGASKAAQKLAQRVTAATQDLAAVCLQAAAGTGKTFLASLMHRESGLKSHPFAEIDCAQLPRDAAGQVDATVLFGAVGESPGLIELLERGTLLIDNVQVLSSRDRDRLVHYLQTGTLTRTVVPSSSDRPAPASTPPITAWVRLILASPQKVSLPDIPCHTIKLLSLAQRKDDIPAFAQAFLAQFCREQGRSPLQLDQGDLRRLISYAYPGNLSELAGILRRAVMMTPPDQTLIPEQVLWSVQSEQNAFRIDLLNQVPWLRPFLLSEWWPDRIWILMMALFVPVTVMGFVGPQTRESSMTLNFFWAWWWPGYLFLFAFVGRVWCAVCPFMITGEWLRRLSLWIWPRSLLPWPTQWLNRWGAWWLFGGFVAIYLWEHLWDLPHHAYLSAWLLIAIAAGAVIGSLIYERRLWCRYLCPIGGMNGMFAKLSMVEVRSTQQVCGSQCSTFGCYKGSPATPVTFPQALPTEGQATAGCPLYSHPAQLQDNRDCVLCMTCLKACPNRSVQVNLRFPASDLLENHRGFAAEVALLLLLLGGVFMHHDHQIWAWLGWGKMPTDAAHLAIALPATTVLLSLPAGLTYLAHAIARRLDPSMPDYVTVVYAYLPFTLAANLAHYIPAAMTEAGQILPVMARTFGLSGAGWPTLTWSPAVAAFLQGVTLLSGLVFSLYPLLRITRRPWWRNWPHLLLLVALTVLCFQLMVYGGA